jgi:CubicO group peptidase (beta-lactamase class C family)
MLRANRRRKAALVTTTMVAVALGVTSCGSVKDPAAVRSSRASDAPALRNPSTYSVLPIPEGQVDRAIAALPDIVSSVMADSQVPGMAVGVTYRGHTAYAAGFGVRKVGAGGAVDADTVFQLASVSKSIGATVVAREVSKGTIAWDTPVQRHLPGFTLKDPWVGSHVTIGDLYAHRSGLPDHAGDDLEEIGYDRAQVISRLQQEPLDPFRTTYHYTNFGLTTAAESVARAAGTSWETLSERDLYTPLGMTSTSSRFADYVARDNRATPHVHDTGTWQPLYQRQPDAQSPAGGVSSSVTDLTKWMALVLADGAYGGEQLISPAALNPALAPQSVSHAPTTPDARAGFYGYGFNVGVGASGRTMVSHSGAFSLGTGTAFSLLPSDELGIVVLTNAAPVGAAETVTNRFMDLVLYGQPTFDWAELVKGPFGDMQKPFGELAGAQPPANPAPARRDTAYVGSYRNSFYGAATVRRTTSGLTLVMGPAQVSYPLKHWSGDVFTFTLRSENAEHGSVSKVTFSQPGRGVGATTRMVVEYFNQTGLGTFTR